MSTRIVRLTGRMFMEDGRYVVVIGEGKVNWATHGASEDEAIADVPRMIGEYLRGYRKHGQLDRYLAKLGIAHVPDVLIVAVGMLMLPAKRAAAGHRPKARPRRQRPVQARYPVPLTIASAP